MMIVMLAALLMGSPGAAQTEPRVTSVGEAAVRAADVNSPTAIVHSVYEIISGERGKLRDWTRFQSLFLPNAIMASTRCKGDAEAGETRVRTVGEYIARNASYFRDNGFFEEELFGRVDRVGSIAHVFSSYASRHDQADRLPFERGINSFELTFDGNRWWILSISWADESHCQALPAAYLGHDRRKR